MEMSNAQEHFDSIFEIFEFKFLIQPRSYSHLYGLLPVNIVF
jgi:hypothetical protein